MLRRPIRFPADFGAHPQTRTEWWYITGSLQHSERVFGFQITFFRSATGIPPTTRASSPHSPAGVRTRCAERHRRQEAAPRPAHRTGRFRHRRRRTWRHATGLRDWLLEREPLRRRNPLAATRVGRHESQRRLRLRADARDQRRTAAARRRGPCRRRARAPAKRAATTASRNSKRAAPSASTAERSRSPAAPGSTTNGAIRFCPPVRSAGTGSASTSTTGVRSPRSAAARRWQQPVRGWQPSRC